MHENGTFNFGLTFNSCYCFSVIVSLQLMITVMFELSAGYFLDYEK